MNFVKVTEICDDFDVCGQTAVITRDGFLLRSDVALSVDLSGNDTYLMVERVEELDGVLYAGQLLLDAVLPGKITAQQLAGMTALELLEVIAR